jgi:hypothetical protein
MFYQGGNIQNLVLGFDTGDISIYSLTSGEKVIVEYNRLKSRSKAFHYWMIL